MTTLKKLLLLPLILISMSASADQLAYLTKAQADKAIKFLNDNQVCNMILWCACCEGEPMRKAKITKYYTRYTGYENYYEIVLEGQLTDGEEEYINGPVDLAYVFLRAGTQAKCLGKLLNMKCDPCTLPFEWK